MLDMVLHINSYISEIITCLGAWFYVLLFIIIFCETGCVLGVFLPGDSLLLTIGITAAGTSLNINLAVFTICIAAILGDSCNYLTGKFIGEKIFSPNARVLKTQYLVATKELLDKHGAKAIIFSRFIAFVRTFTPFIAGTSQMNYPKFVFYGIISAIIWSFSITYTVYFFSANSFVKHNLSLIIMGVIAVVVGQMIIKHLINIRHRKKN